MEKTKVMAYIGLYGDIFPLEEITAALQIEPTEAYTKGDLVIREPHPALDSTRKLYRKFTAWRFGTDYEESVNVDDQLKQVIQPLKDKVGIINELKRKYSLRVVLTIVIIMEEGRTPGFQLTPNKHLDFLSNIGSEISIDLYAHPYQEEPPISNQVE